MLNGTVPVDPDYTPPLQEYYPWTPFFDSIREFFGLPKRIQDTGPIKLDPIEPADSFEEGTGLFGGLYKVMKQALDSKGIEVGLEVTPDESSAEEAATEAADIAKVTLKENPAPLPYALPNDEYYEYAGETDEATYGKYSVELEDGGTLEEILAVSKLDGSKVIVTIQTNGDG